MVTRIRQLLDTKQLTPTQFADFIGVGRPVMSHILSERNKPSLEVVQRIISAFPDISLPWLLSGLGEMLEATTTAALAPTDAPVAPSVAPPAVASATPDTVLPAPEVASAVPTAPPAAPSTAAMVPQPLRMASPAPRATFLGPEAIVPAEEPDAASSLAASEAEKQPIAPASPAAPPRTAAAPRIEVPVATHALPAPAGFAPVSPPFPAAGKPFRAARFVPAAPASSVPPAVTPPMPAVAMSSYVVAPATGPALPMTTAVAKPAGREESTEAALLPFLGNSGKAIRRIVIFYQDGSFADYQPEA
ncbi:hypothetical protein GCM10027422_01020 [Hymenobacter arcticus]